MNWYQILAMATPLISILGVNDCLRLARDALAAEGRSEYLIPMYLWIMLWFFAYCYPIARWTIRLERNWAVNACEHSKMSWMPNEPIVSIREVHKSFGSLEVLKGVSLNVAKGEVVCIIGPSGSGKSTLLRSINALIPIDKGSIVVKGQQVHDPRLDKLELRKKVGMVFQQYNLFPHRTALQNI